MALLLCALLTAACWAHFHGTLRHIALAACALCTAYAWFEPKNRIRALTVDADGRAYISSSGVMREAVLCGGSLISRHICFLIWQDTEGRRYHQCVLPDMCSRVLFRRLRVWARYGKSKH